MRKRIGTIILMMIMVLGAATPARAAFEQGSIMVSGASGRHGDTVYVNVMLNHAPQGDTVGIAMEYDSSVLEMVEKECKWTKQGTLYSFDKRKRTAVWAEEKVQDLNGTLCTLAFRIKPGAASGAAKVTYEVTLKQDSKGVGHYYSESEIEVLCAHMEKDFSGVDSNLHEQTCKACGFTEKVPHRWDAGKVIVPATEKVPGIMWYSCPDCGFGKEEAVTYEEQQEAERHPNPEEEHQHGNEQPGSQGSSGGYSGSGSFVPGHYPGTAGSGSNGDRDDSEKPEGNGAGDLSGDASSGNASGGNGSSAGNPEGSNTGLDGEGNKPLGAPAENGKGTMEQPALAGGIVLVALIAAVAACGIKFRKR